MQTNFEIPPIIWSGVIGALVALFGNVIANTMANWAAARRQREQQLHDANQRRMDREMSLKREIFLDLADGMGQRIQELINIARQAVAGPQQVGAPLDGGGRHKAVIGRAEVIASPETLRELHKAEEYYARSTLELLERQIALNVTWGRITQLEADGEAHLKLMNPGPDTPLPPERFEALLRIWSENQAQLEAVRRTREDELCRLFIEAARRAQEYSELLTEPMLAIRRELGIETDAEVFRRSGRGSWTESPAQMIERLMGRAQKILEGEPPSQDGPMQIRREDGQ